MSVPVTAGDASLAQTCSDSRQLSREPSKEGLGSAAVLSLFTQSHERFSNLRDSISQAPHIASSAHATSTNGTSSSPSEVPEHHPLDDMLNYQHGIQNTQTSQPQATPNDLPQRSMVNNAPVVGQVCRYVLDVANHITDNCA